MRDAMWMHRCFCLFNIKSCAFLSFTDDTCIHAAPGKNKRRRPLLSRSVPVHTNSLEHLQLRIEYSHNIRYHTHDLPRSTSQTRRFHAVCKQCSTSNFKWTAPHAYIPYVSPSWTRARTMLLKSVQFPTRNHVNHSIFVLILWILTPAFRKSIETVHVCNDLLVYRHFNWITCDVPLCGNNCFAVGVITIANSSIRRDKNVNSLGSVHTTQYTCDAGEQ